MYVWERKRGEGQRQAKTHNASSPALFLSVFESWAIIWSFDAFSVSQNYFSSQNTDTSWLQKSTVPSHFGSRYHNATVRLKQLTSVIIKKFADDTVIYRRELASLIIWCEDNYCTPNTDKMREMVSSNDLALLEGEMVLDKDPNPQEQRSGRSPSKATDCMDVKG